MMRRRRGGGVFYGVQWNQSTDSYTRTGELEGETLSSSPGNAKLPIHAKLRRCVVSDAGVVQYYLDPDDSTLKADGVTASVLDGTDGQVMVEVPAFYYKYSYDSDVHTWEISESGGNGFDLHPAFSKNGVTVDKRYISAYEGYVDGTKLSSITGVTPTVSQTRAQFRTAAEARGTGWHQFDATLVHLLQVLYVVEYADLDSQAMIGNGNTAYPSWPGSPPSTTGNSNAAGDATANQTTAGGAAGDYMSYRGVENWYGHIWKFLDGINIHNSSANGSRVYVSQNPTDYADDTDTGYSLAGLAAEADGYGLTLIPDGRLMFPSSVGATSASAISDYYYTYFDNDADSGWREALLGGAASPGANAGAFCVYSLNGSSFAHSSIGGRLAW